MPRIVKLLFSGCVFLLACVYSPPVWAVQTHGGSEGLVSHQIGHLLFIIGMATILFMVLYSRITGPGWLMFKGFLVLIVLWNVLTFSGHWLNEFIDMEKFVYSHGNKVGFRVENSADFFFYISQLDHLVLIPALIFLGFSLKIWRQA